MYCIVYADMCIMLYSNDIILVYVNFNVISTPSSLKSSSSVYATWQELKTCVLHDLLVHWTRNTDNVHNVLQLSQIPVTYAFSYKKTEEKTVQNHQSPYSTISIHTHDYMNHKSTGFHRILCNATIDKCAIWR